MGGEGSQQELVGSPRHEVLGSPPAQARLPRARAGARRSDRGRTVSSTCGSSAGGTSSSARCPDAGRGPVPLAGPTAQPQRPRVGHHATLVVLQDAGPRRRGSDQPSARQAAVKVLFPTVDAAGQATVRTPSVTTPAWNESGPGRVRTSWLMSWASRDTTRVQVVDARSTSPSREHRRGRHVVGQVGEGVVLHQERRPQSARTVRAISGWAVRTGDPRRQKHEARSSPPSALRPSAAVP